MNKYLQFDVENAEVIGSDDDSQFATARIQAFSSGKNLHNLVCSEEVLRETAHTLDSKPILYTVDENLQDFFTHTEPSKSLICGFIVPDSAEFKRLPDSRLSVNVIAKIWKKYSPKVIEFFKRDSEHKKKVSVEMEVYELGDRQDGLTDMLDFNYFGVCLLGDFVREASPDANMQILSFSEEQKEYNDAYVAEFADKYSDLNFAIPSDVKKNAQEGLDLYKKHKRGGTSVSLNIGKHLTKNDSTTSEKIRHIEKHFSLHSSDDFENKTGKEWISWQLYGGNSGMSWSKKLVESMNKIDGRKVAFFQEGDLVTFPYKNIEDANPSLKNWNPPLSLSQINSIAKQADAIGGEYGWPTAIKHFKSTHESNKEGTAWVEKSKEEKMADEIKKPEEMAVEKPAETPAEEKKEEKAEPASEEKKIETPEEEKKEEEKEKEMSVAESKFSLDTYLDVSATLAFLKSATEDADEISDEYGTKLSMATDEIAKADMADPGIVMSGMFAAMCRMSAKMCKMAEAKKAADEEMSALKEFKASVEEQQKKFAVEQTLRDLGEKFTIPDDARTAMIEDSEKYIFANINVWQNNTKAKCVDFAVKVPKDGNKPEIKRYAMPFSGIPTKPKNDLWAGAKK